MKGHLLRGLAIILGGGICLAGIGIGDSAVRYTIPINERTRESFKDQLHMTPAQRKARYDLLNYGGVALIGLGIVTTIGIYALALRADRNERNR